MYINPVDDHGCCTLIRIDWKSGFDLPLVLVRERSLLTLKLPCGVHWTPHNIPTAVKVKRKMTWQRYFNVKEIAWSNGPSGVGNGSYISW